MPPDIVLYPCTGIGTGTGTATSLLCEVIHQESIASGHSCAWQAGAVEKESGRGWWAGGVTQTGCASLTSVSTC